jgi:[ribosomal protein S5]-alanine N-acetyltransferase
VSLPTLALDIGGWCLRAWREADAPSLARLADNVSVWRNMSDRFPNPYTLEIARDWVTHGHVEFGGDNWAITLDDIAVGGCGLQRGEGQFGCQIEIGYWLGEPYWGRGVACRAVHVLSRRALAMPGVVRVFAGVHADNVASMRVLEKNGFEREGTLRKGALKAGVPIDRVIYAKIAA